MEKNKKSKIQLFILIILIIILIVAVVLNIYLLMSKKDNNKNIAETENVNIAQNISENNLNQTDYTTNNTNTTNTFSNSLDISNINSVVVDFTDGLDTEELRKFMEMYSVGIQRISFDEENLESNTILLFIAKQYFDSNTNKSSLEINTNYAATVENVHKFLSELTGKDYSNVEYIPSYANYIGYISSSKSYIFGSDYNNIKREIYNCSDLSIINEDNGLYTATAKVSRTIDKEVTNYELTFTFTINQNFTYAKYCIKSLKIKNTSFYPDNTIHLIDNVQEETEE